MAIVTAGAPLRIHSSGIVVVVTSKLVNINPYVLKCDSIKDGYTSQTLLCVAVHELLQLLTLKNQ